MPSSDNNKPHDLEQGISSEAWSEACCLDGCKEYIAEPKSTSKVNVPIQAENYSYERRHQLRQLWQCVYIGQRQIILCERVKWESIFWWSLRRNFKQF